MGLRSLYTRLPDVLKPVVKSIYYLATEGHTEAQLRREFVETLFHSREEYERYVTEFEDGSAAELRREALAAYAKFGWSNDVRGGVGMDVARDYYAVTRTLQPSTVVETGVCNGLSTLALLLALDQNESGRLYSIDYPYRADEPLESFRAETFAGYGGAAIPSDKDPGWIIPDDVRDRWDLTIGKSQRELPRLLTTLDQVDLFVHDSEHSHPCMMFEYELAYEWLSDGGVILSDDTNLNDAFDVFTRVRSTDSGKLSRSVGYIRNSSR